MCDVQSECVAYVIATFPKQVQTDAISAEVIGADYLFSILPQLPHLDEPWESRLAYYASKHLLVLRPILIDSANYAEHLAKVSDWTGKGIRKNLIEGLKHMTPEKLWMVELSVPELFSANRRKIGEVLLHAETPPGSPRDFSSFILARLPGCFALYEGGGPTEPRYRFVPSGADGHVELAGCEEAALNA